MAASFLALGDSYTIGEGVDVQLRWPAQLATRLREEGHSFDPVDVIATTGWTTDELAGALQGAQLRDHYDLVSLLIGVNNQYRGRDLENYRIECAGLIDFAIGKANGRAQRVMVLSIPDWGVTPFAAAQGADAERVAAHIDHFNAIARELSIARGTAWIDVTDISRGAGRDMLTEDGLHPSAEQYALWAERVLPAARAVLGQPA
ncbi:MAG: SGNH/GDSL hydrolase family protein [Dokdonella sp.]|jgi:lysophospholipase L1-like esterase|uniref:SGNH/GDSL hydrolase family protein n=1 Tax=Dokdonella sp. TaxID=2291710 RepID=UPI0025C5FC6D|nr:SGNH/GDSL hydrolase family protein [Dokdonella sp.]MBK8124230.1 SGNH/GDSL hydrolase family protein [Dokdonella sp.]